MKDISKVSFNGKRVLIRVDFNVPLDSKHKITDDSRMRAAIPTIKAIVSTGGMAIIMSHLGRPKCGFETRFSLQNIVGHLSVLLKNPVSFSTDCVGKEAVKKSQSMKNGDVLLLENLRFHPEEKLGDKLFAKKLSNLADVYVNDAFGTAHRKHASTAIVAKYFPKNKYFGMLLSAEIKNLKYTLNNPKRPFTAIIGGAKITGKIDVINSLFKKVDYLVVGGGMSYTFIRALGGETGNSLLEEEKVILAKELIENAKKNNVVLVLPSDSVNANKFENSSKTKTSNIYNIPSGFMGLDIGPKSIMSFEKVISKSKTIVWNGPMGVFEMNNFEKGTKKISEAIALATKNGAFSLVGGGDSVAAVKQFGLSKKFSYISTGGGAMLEYLEGKNLPGVTAIES